MKKVLLFSFILLSSFSLNAQLDIGGEIDIPIIPMGIYRYHRICYLITPAEMKASSIKAGAQITSIRFTFEESSGYDAYGNMKVYLQNTKDIGFYHSSNVWSNGVNGIIDSAVLVHNANTLIPNTWTTWTITFSNPSNFVYTGGGLYVSFDYSNPSGSIFGWRPMFRAASSGVPGNLACRFDTSFSGSPAVLNNSTGSRPATSLGYLNYNADINEVYAPGKTPIFNNTPVTISANISNKTVGFNYSFNVTLDVTGANTFTNTKSINIPAGSSSLVQFDSFIPTVEGDNTVTVTIPFDTDTSKNKKSYYMKTTQSSFNYADTSASEITWGEANSPLFYTKFFIKGNTKVNSVSCYINNSTTFIGIPVYGIAVNKDNNVIITRTPEYKIQGSDLGKWITLDFPNPPAYYDANAYIGIAVPAFIQGGKCIIGTQWEYPVRESIFYSGDIGFNTFYYFACYRYMIQANLSANTNNQVYLPEGLNMPGLFNGWSNPPSKNAFSGVQRTGGQLLPAENNARPLQRNTRVYSTVIKTAASGGDCTEGSYPWLFTSGPTSNYYQNKWGGVNVTMNTVQNYIYNSPNDNNVTLTNDTYYVVNWMDRGYTDTKAIWMPVTESPGKIRSIDNRYHGTGINDTLIISFSKAISGNIYIRYSSDNWNTWDFVEYAMNPNYVKDTVVIPASMVTANGSFYVMTSGLSLGELKALTLSEDIDLATISSYQGAFTTSLPVELTSFTADVKESSVLLNWSTASELNNKGFEVQRKSSDGNWITAGFVNGAGSSSESVGYSFIDKNLASGKYSYRLKQIDFNGEYKYSDIVNADVTAPESFSLSQNYPNPFNPTTKIEYNIPVDAMVKLEVFSVTGEKISELVNTELAAGYYSVDVNASVLKGAASGVYLYKLTATEKHSGNNFVSTHKMLLLK